VRSTMVKVGLASMLASLVGASIVLAAASSKPGMFLYPIRRVTYGWTQWFTRTTVVSLPSRVPADERPVVFPEPVPAVVGDVPGSDAAPIEAIQVSVPPAPLTSPPCSAAAATPVPARIADVVEPAHPTALPPAAGRALVEADAAPIEDVRMDVPLVVPAELIPGVQGASADDGHASHQQGIHPGLTAQTTAQSMLQTPPARPGASIPTPQTVTGGTTGRSRPAHTLTIPTIKPWLPRRSWSLTTNPS